jgi:hypothetical protein
METSQILNRAADLIEERGWTRGVFGWDDEEGGLCLEGGILAALGLTSGHRHREEFLSCPAYRAVQNYLGLVRAELPHDDALNRLWFWNDYNGNKEQVIEVLRAAALIELAKENQSVEVSA